MNSNQNAFQNAGKDGFSYYNSIGNQTSTFLVLILALIILAALLRSERRYRELLERLGS
jgi:hypothetical protein